MKKINKILVTGASGNLGRSMIYYLDKFNFSIIAADCSAELLCAPPSIKRYILPKASAQNYFSELNKIIIRNDIDVVLFNSDAEIRAASVSLNKIRAKTWLPPHKTVVLMQDKYYCNKEWEKAGLPVPRSEIVFNKSQLKG